MMQWPPLIKLARQERWRIWRDAIITIIVWAFFLFIFISQSVLFWRSISEFQAEHPGAFLENWDFRLAPFATIVFGLLIWLLFFGWRSLRRLKHLIRKPAPPNLPIATESTRRGMPVESIAKARELKVATVVIDDAGRFSAT